MHPFPQECKTIFARGLLKAIALNDLYFSDRIDYFRFDDHSQLKILKATASATLMPSIPAERIPPAYPAPSPAG